MRPFKIIFFCLLSLSGIVSLPDVFCQVDKKTEYIRVLILKDTKKFNLHVKGEYEICSKISDTVLSTGDWLNAEVGFDDYGININDNSFKEEEVIIYPKAGYLYVNNRPLRGALLVKKDKDLKLLAINYLEVEDYVKGVLFHEVSHHWPIEAIKAQAVATRTYALYHAQMNKGKDYDLTADTYSQVYGGKNSERYRTNVAAERTKGRVLTYKGKIFPAYFHATCGGRTEDADQLWDINIAPLKRVDCKFCVKSKHFKWRKNLPAAKILVKLNNAGYKINSLDKIEILDRNRSGRVKDMKLKSKNGDLVISAKDFRQALGSSDIRSTNFSLKFSGDVAYFEGFGWGHGVGLCQWGAYFASRKGMNYQQILKHYYLQAEIVNYNKGEG